MMSKFLQSIKKKFTSSPTMAEGGKVTAIVNGKVVADADTWQEVEGNIYVSVSAFRRSFNG